MRIEIRPRRLLPVTRPIVRSVPRRCATLLCRREEAKFGQRGHFALPNPYKRSGRQTQATQNKCITVARGDDKRSTGRPEHKNKKPNIETKEPKPKNRNRLNLANFRLSIYRNRTIFGFSVFYSV
jgi:hypothetical protein